MLLLGSGGRGAMVVVVMVVMVLGTPMMAGVRVMIPFLGEGEGVMADMSVLKTGIEGWVGDGVDGFFTSGDCKGLQHVKNNLAL
jgi:hypothetical protein